MVIGGRGEKKGVNDGKEEEEEKDEDTKVAGGDSRKHKQSN